MKDAMRIISVSCVQKRGASGGRRPELDEVLGNTYEGFASQKAGVID